MVVLGFDAGFQVGIEIFFWKEMLCRGLLRVRKVMWLLGAGEEGSVWV